VQLPHHHEIDCRVKGIAKGLYIVHGIDSRYFGKIRFRLQCILENDSCLLGPFFARVNNFRHDNRVALCHIGNAPGILLPASRRLKVPFQGLYPLKD